MAKVERRIYGRNWGFTQHGDALGKNPTKDASPKRGDRAAAALANELDEKQALAPQLRFFNSDGSPTSNAKQEAEYDSFEAIEAQFTGPPPDDRQEEEAPKTKGWGFGFLDLILNRKKPNEDYVPNPIAQSEHAGVSMSATGHKNLSPTEDESLGVLQIQGLKTAKEKFDAIRSKFVQYTADGIDGKDRISPNLSLALFGFRVHIGSDKATTTHIEYDKLLFDGLDDRDNPAVDRNSFPMTWQEARDKMYTGERKLIATGQAVFGELGLKYTPTFIPGFSSSMLHDFGLSGSISGSVAVEGETALEVIRGANNEVAVAISVRDDRATPGDDITWKAHAGLHLDADTLDYGYSLLAAGQVESELYTLEDRKRYGEQYLAPKAAKVNDYSEAVGGYRKRNSEGRVGLYEVVLDLDQPQAREIFEALTGADQGKGLRSLNVGALKDLPPDSGVKIVTNNVRKAARKGIEKTFRRNGIEARRVELSEDVDNRATDGTGPVEKEERHGVILKRRDPDSRTHKEFVGRVKRIQDGETTTDEGVGFGLRFEVDDAKASASELGELLSFAENAGQKFSAGPQLATLWLDKEGDASAGDKDVGRVRASLSVELNSGAVHRLSRSLAEPRFVDGLWPKLAAAYQRSHNLSEPPNWPDEGLLKKGLANRLKRATSKGSDASFLLAHRAMGLLGKVNKETDREAKAKLLAHAFELLQDDMDLAGVLVDAARSEDPKDESVQVKAQLEGDHGVLQHSETDMQKATEIVRPVAPDDADDDDSADGVDTTDEAPKEPIPDPGLTPPVSNDDDDSAKDDEPKKNEPTADEVAAAAAKAARDTATNKSAASPEP